MEVEEEEKKLEDKEKTSSRGIERRESEVMPACHISLFAAEDTNCMLLPQDEKEGRNDGTLPHTTGQANASSETPCYLTPAVFHDHRHE
ncbi:hypothetical protein E2C01_032673 [Portunus trituberculatus]|uniref:Uncharacterized protein n=1 Tax=Portunus trituberculatus TaxID=210409 RepID=A0A5B7EWK1_PORTR|nr:hypothetical protein [Portunus trituberculatus]